MLSMLPLIIAVSYAALEMSSQARAQQRLVMDQAQISQLSITVQELNKEIERSARQYQLLQDQSLLEILKIKQHQLSESLSKIERQLPELKNSSTLTKIEKTVANINKVSRSDARKQKQQLSTLYADLKSAGNDLHNQLSKAVQSNLNNAEQALNNVLWRMLITGLLALPASLLLLGASSIIVTRSIRRLSLAINHLGERSWDTPIDIDGPSDLIELGHRLEWMRVQLLGAEQYKAQFTQHITHELKSPLAAIMDAQALLADQIPGQLNDKQMAVLTILRNQAENLQELIQQLLNFNAVSQGIAAHKEQIDLSLMCKNLIARYRSFLPDTALNIKAPSNGQLVTANAQLIEMILSNLLSNAIHFCRTGGEIAINWGHCNIKQHSHDVNAPPEDCSHWWLQVSDNGPGIDIDEQEAVFRPFYQGKNKRHGALKGSGIGLAIVKACAEQAQATLTLKSQKDQGAEFTLCFPKQR